MPDLFADSQFSSGWKPVVKIDENKDKAKNEMEMKLKRMVSEFDKMKTAYDEKVSKVLDDAKMIQISLNDRINELTAMLSEKNNEIKKLREDHVLLDEKYKSLQEQFEILSSKGFFSRLLKK